MTDQVEIIISLEDARWQATIPDVETLCERAARAALAASHAQDDQFLPEGPCELSLVLADDDTVQGLNRDYRGKDKPTNVLSFALYADGGGHEQVDSDPPDEGDDDEDTDEDVEFLSSDGPVPVLLGDVILAFDTIDREAREQRKSLDNHLTHLVTHGVLHLLGFDHIEDDEALLMERLETQILSGLGIADPYAGRDPADPYLAPDESGGSAAEDPGGSAAEDPGGDTAGPAPTTPER